jgi:hypothetical protein
VAVRLLDGMLWLATVARRAAFELRSQFRGQAERHNRALKCSVAV